MCCIVSAQSTFLTSPTKTFYERDRLTTHRTHSHTRARTMPPIKWDIFRVFARTFYDVRNAFGNIESVDDGKSKSLKEWKLKNQIAARSTGKGERIDGCRLEHGLELSGLKSALNRVISNNG